MMLTPSPMVRSGSAALAINGKLAAIDPAATAFAVVPLVNVTVSFPLIDAEPANFTFDRPDSATESTATAELFL